MVGVEVPEKNNTVGDYKEEREVGGVSSGCEAAGGNVDINWGKGATCRESEDDILVFQNGVVGEEWFGVEVGKRDGVVNESEEAATARVVREREVAADSGAIGKS